MLIEHYTTNYYDEHRNRGKLVSFTTLSIGMFTISAVS